jgi:hypothetical protein
MSSLYVNVSSKRTMIQSSPVIPAIPKLSNSFKEISGGHQYQKTVINMSTVALLANELNPYDKNHLDYSPLTKSPRTSGKSSRCYVESSRTITSSSRPHPVIPPSSRHPVLIPSSRPCPYPILGSGRTESGSYQRSRRNNIQPVVAINVCSASILIASYVLNFSFYPVSFVMTSVLVRLLFYAINTPLGIDSSALLFSSVYKPLNLVSFSSL